MIAQKISNLHQFTKQLFLEQTFDSFLVSELTISTYNSFHIDGRLKREFFTEEEWNKFGSERFSSWAQLRPICFSLIKGKKLPLSFQIILRLSNSDMELLFSDTPLPTELDGLFLNIVYKNEELICTSGTAYKQFTMNRSTDQLWDRYLTDLLEKIIEL